MRWSNGIIASGTAIALIFCMMPVQASERTSMSNSGTAQIEAEVVIGSSFTVGLPTSVALDSTSGVGGYDIAIKGDIDPMYQLMVAPKDEVDSVDGTNFNLEKQGVFDKNPEVITMEVEDPKTVFSYDDVNPDTETLVHCNLKPASGQSVRPGKWKGTLTYDIQLSQTEHN